MTMFGDEDEDDCGSFTDDFESDSCDYHRDEPPERLYRIVPASEIHAEMDAHIDQVNDIFHIKPSQVKRLLVHFKWNTEQLIEQYYEHSDYQQLFRTAGIHVDDEEDNTDSSSFQRQISNPTDRGECEVCLLPDTTLEGLSCRHLFCRACWRSYLTVMLTERGSSEDIRCMARECTTIANESFVMEVLPAEALRNRYRQLMTSNFISTNKSYKWCPSPGCTYAAQVYGTDVQKITCTCGMEWCFGCQEPFHAPLQQCGLLRRWLEKAADDSGNTSWMVNHTKECPKCKAVIEKNGGCNHMTCTNMACAYEFCWQCLGVWSTHGNSWYNCNKFEETETKSQTNERREMNRYHHYYKRYANHKRSYDLEQQMYEESIHKKTDYIQDVFKLPWIDVQFLRLASEVLGQCRTMLKYSYVFGYYIVTCPDKDIFEVNQSDLEHNTELLSDCLENAKLPGSPEEVQELKMRVNDLSTYCYTRRNVLLDHVQEGYDRNVWKFLK